MFLKPEKLVKTDFWSLEIPLQPVQVKLEVLHSNMFPGGMDAAGQGHTEHTLAEHLSEQPSLISIVATSSQTQVSLCASLSILLIIFIICLLWAPKKVRGIQIHTPKIL